MSLTTAQRLALIAPIESTKNALDMLRLIEDGGGNNNDLIGVRHELKRAIDELNIVLDDGKASEAA